ncbi:hypothetical protein Esti_005634 [Eimeria stiedai]
MIKHACYHCSSSFLQVVPFRLTQNIRAAFGTTDTAGDFRGAAAAVLRILRTNQHLLLSLFMVRLAAARAAAAPAAATLAAGAPAAAALAAGEYAVQRMRCVSSSQSFVLDPLIEWKASASRHQQQQQQQRESAAAAAAAASAWERKAYSCIVSIQQKLRGTISALPPGAFDVPIDSEEQQQQQPSKQQTRMQQQRDAMACSSSSSDEDSFAESGDEGSSGGASSGSAAAGATAAAAAAAAAAHSSGTLGVYAQVDALIRAASSDGNLCRMYRLKVRALQIRRKAFFEGKLSCGCN